MKEKETATGNHTAYRPAAFRLLCLFAITFHGFILLLLLAGLFNSGWLTEMLSQYQPDISTKLVILPLLTGIVLLAAIISGIILMYFTKKSGLYLYILASIFLISTFILFVELDWLAIIIESLFVLLFIFLIPKSR